jgi:Flp pilus assembly protein TadD
LKPSYALAHLNLGGCLLKQRDRAGATRALQDAVRYRPDLADAHVELGAVLLQDGKAGEAIPHLENAVRLDAKNARARTLLEQARARKQP